MTIYNAPEYSAFKGPFVGRDGQAFIPDPGLIAAANVALAVGRPLLLTGAPGSGKTEFAFAAASSLAGEQARPLQYYVRSDTTARDLLYRYDTVRRFSDAQTATDETSRRRARYPQNYIQLEALGRALVSGKREVVLIDEIDKAQRDLPNDLLRELDQGWFEIAEITEPVPDDASAGAEASSLRREMRPPGDIAARPFIIITSNVERQLPDAFLRRCVFYYVPFPEDTLLIDILRSRFPKLEHHEQTVALFMTLREQSMTKRPATAELIDWVRALATVFDPAHAWPRIAAQAERRLAGEPIDWSALDAMSALVKLREDLAMLGLDHSAAAVRS